MNYAKHYENLIERARLRGDGLGYVERHHVLPRCLGGTDDPANIVPLFPEEHFIAHQLLVKIHKGDSRLIFAAWSMTRGKGRQNKRYGWLRRQMSMAMTGRVMSQEARQKIAASRRGSKLTDAQKAALHGARRGSSNTAEHNEKVSRALKGRKFSDSHVSALRESRSRIQYTAEVREKMGRHNRGRPLSESQRAALMSAIKGKPLSPEHKAKVSAAKQGKLQPMAMCPHCSKTGGASLMRRWHFDNCKVIKHD